MSQKTTTLNEKTWAVVSVLKENVSTDQLDRVVPQLSNVIDQWHSKGKFILSGPFDDNKTSLTILHGTDEEIHNFYDQYKKVTSDVVDTYVYGWDALPLLTLL